LLLEADGAHVRWPGFRDPRLGLPDRTFAVLGESVAAHLAQGTDLLASAWEQPGDDLLYTASVRVPVVGDVRGATLRLVQGAMPKSADKPGARRVPAGRELPAPVGEITAEPAEDGTATVLRARVPLERRTVKLGVRVYLDVAGSTYEIPVRGTGKPMPLARRWGREEDPYRASALVNDKGRVVVHTARMHPPRHTLAFEALRGFAGKLKRKLKSTLKRALRPVLKTKQKSRRK
jgi:hypothetical protein